jgi:hypothetical protein
MAEYGYAPRAGKTFRSHIVDLGQHKIERAIRSKSDLDFAFFYGSHQVYGEAYKLGEFSKNRCVVCLVVISMFPWIVKTAGFPNPSKLVYRVGALLRGAILSGTVDNGIFRCLVKHHPEYAGFLNRFGPFYFGRHGVSYPVAQAEGEVFEVLLHACEINALAPMCDIEVVDGVFSLESIAHPLASWVDRYYETKRHGTPHQRTVAKAALTTLHTCASRVSTEDKWLAASEVDTEFAVRFGSGPFTSSRYAQVRSEREDGAKLMSLYKVDNDKNVYSFASTVYAESRARMLTLFAKLDGLLGATVCYSNIDSIHLSVRHNRLEALLAEIDSMHGIGPDLGQLKVEAVARRALWLDAGVYWLGDENGKLIKHASINPDPDKAFALSARYLTKDLLTGEPATRRLRLFKTLSVSKQLSPDGRWLRATGALFGNGVLPAVMQRLSQQEQVRHAFDKFRADVHG